MKWIMISCHADGKIEAERNWLRVSQMACRKDKEDPEF